MSDFRGNLFLPVIRGMERVLPARGFCGLLYSVAWVRALLHGCFKPQPRSAFPEGIPGMRPAAPTRWYRLPVYLSRTFQYFPDRLGTAKWRSYCRYSGLETVLELTRKHRPVVLVFAHFGPFTLLRNWLRAAGVPVAMFAGGRASERPRLARRKDRHALFPNVPLVFYNDQLSEAARHLKNGGSLAIAIDVDSGRDLQVPVGAGWWFKAASGPIRLARAHGAVLVACSTYNDRDWHVALELGAPIEVPSAKTPDIRAASDLIQTFLPVWLAHPEAWTGQLASHFVQHNADDTKDCRNPDA